MFDQSYINVLLKYKTVYVGYSGGLDSTVLLHSLVQLKELKDRVHAIHINHGVSSHADDWEQHCHQWCERFKIPLTSERVCLTSLSNLEENARLARHKVFQTIVTQDDCLVLAHHQQDQAETVLLNLFRGAGVDGLAAMSAYQELSTFRVYRPLITCTKEQIQTYAHVHELQWVEDESNQNENLARNFVRHQVIPLIQTFWPAASQNIARAGKHCRIAKDHLETLAALDCPEVLSVANRLQIDKLKALSEDRLQNVLRFWLKQTIILLPSTAVLKRVVKEVIYSRSDSMACVRFADSEIRRYRNYLYCIQTSKQIINSISLEELPSDLQLPANVSKFEVKYREGGETFRLKGQTKLLKKLFQQWQIPPWLREQVPLLYINNELAAVLGYAISDSFYKPRLLSTEIVDETTSD